MKAKILLAAVALGIAAAAAFALSSRSTAPEVRFATLSGEQFSTSDLRGKVVLVNFWATWCTTCVAEMPRMIDTYRKFAPQGYEMVAVAVQSDHPNQVAAFTQKRALPFKVALDGNGDAHHLVNRTKQDVLYLEIGDRTRGDSAVYPDEDMQVVQDAEGNWRYLHKDGTPY